MNLRKIHEWHRAGVIDAATRERLLAYEAQHARPLALWAVFGLGALAIGLGLVSVVAANWEAIPPMLRLAVHFALLAGLLAGLIAALAVRAGPLAAASPWAIEALVFVIAALGLGFLGHLGQAYQTSSPLWQPLALWLALFGPLLLLQGRSWLVAATLLGGLVWCVWDYAAQGPPPGGASNQGVAAALWLGAITALPVLAAPVAGALRSHGARIDFWRHLEQLALAYAVAGASLGAVLASIGASSSDAVMEMAAMAARGIVGLAAGAALMRARPGLSGQRAGLVIIGAAIALPLAQAAAGLTVPAAALFIALWAGIAAAAIRAGWRGVFQLSAALIAARLVILSFELASDLLLSGFGLILSGLLILAAAWGVLKVSRRLAPPQGGASQ
ncbi:MAG: DUF2157 domain-containing protein [Erythrobacter sp.]